MPSGLVFSRCCRRRWAVLVDRSGMTGGSWRGSFSGTGAGCRGVTSRRNSARGRHCGNDTGAIAATGRGIGCSRSCWSWLTRLGLLIGRCRWTPRSTVLTSTQRTCLATQGDLSNYTNLRLEPPDHGIGRSRGGLSTKIHALTDGKGRPLVLLVAPGQGGDAPMLPHLMGQLRINRVGPGRARTRPERLRADKAYSSRAIRQHLRDRGIIAVIPQPSDQIGHRKRRGSAGGRPPTFDADDYRGRNVVERSFCDQKQWRGIATRYDKLAITYRGGAVLRAITIWLKALGDTP